MAHAYQCLAQRKPATGGAYETLFTGNTGKQYIISALHVANTHATAADAFFVRLRKGGVAAAAEHVLYNGPSIDAKDAYPLLTGYCFEDGDIIEVASTSGNVTFNLFGDEVS